jgi:hypothetical protein
MLLFIQDLLWASGLTPEGIILGNEDARICWPFDLMEKLYSESDGQGLCSPALHWKKAKDGVPTFEGM